MRATHQPTSPPAQQREQREQRGHGDAYPEHLHLKVLEWQIGVFNAFLDQHFPAQARVRLRTLTLADTHQVLVAIRQIFGIEAIAARL